MKERGNVSKRERGMLVGRGRGWGLTTAIVERVLFPNAVFACAELRCPGAPLPPLPFPPPPPAPGRPRSHALAVDERHITPAPEIQYERREPEQAGGGVPSASSTQRMFADVLGRHVLPAVSHSEYSKSPH